jgi:hypothetical protein
MGDELKRALNAIMAFKSEIAPPPPDRLAIAVAALREIAEPIHPDISFLSWSQQRARKALAQIGADNG